MSIKLYVTEGWSWEEEEEKKKFQNSFKKIKYKKVQDQQEGSQIYSVNIETFIIFILMSMRYQFLVALQKARVSLSNNNKSIFWQGRQLFSSSRNKIHRSKYQNRLQNYSNDIRSFHQSIVRFNDHIFSSILTNDVGQLKKLLSEGHNPDVQNDVGCYEYNINKSLFYNYLFYF